MPAKAEDIYKNKIRIIYEYNQTSPVFARIANWELENDNYETAIEILEKGIRNNPDFPTPYFILAKAYCKSGEFDKAFKCYKKGSDLIHSKETYLYYLRELESLRKLKTPPEFRSIGFPEGKNEFQEEVSEIIPTDNSRIKKKDVKSSSIEDNLDELAERISNAKIPAVKEGNSEKYNSDDESKGSMIVSETLAKIYLAQGEIQEAITVYEKLSKRDPAKENYFTLKISELKSKL